MESNFNWQLQQVVKNLTKQLLCQAFILVFQWRHFGAEYVDMHADYSGKGVDQLANVINLIRFQTLLAFQPHQCNKES